MLQFLITGKDGTDPEALSRRMAARPFHLAGASKLKKTNNFVMGGATLDEDGNMNGSVMIVQFETEEALKQYMNAEPYITENVWKQVEVKPFRVADV